MDAVTFDVRLAARTLRRAPAFTVVTVATLALGLALTATTLAIVNAYRVGSLPYPAADRLHHVMYAPPGVVEPGGMSQLDWASLADVVEHPVMAAAETFYLTDDGITQTVRGIRAGPGFGPGLGVNAVLGRTFRSEDFAPGSERVALIGHALWQERFGAEPDVVGRLLRAEPERAGAGRETFRIVGVLPPGFWFGRDSRERVDLLVPLTESARTYMVRLQPGVPAGLAEARTTEAARVVATSLPGDWQGVRLQAVHDRYIEALRPILRSTLAAATLVLVIACANVGVLLLLRALRRQHDFRVRVALGAGRARIVRTLLVENGLLVSASLTLGLALTAVALRALGPAVELQLGRPAPGRAAGIALDPAVLLVIVGAGCVIVGALSILPLAAPWERRLAGALRRGRGASEGPAMRHFRSALVSFELAGSLALLIGAGLMTRSAVNLLRTELGFETHDVSRVRLVVPGRLASDPAALAIVYDRLLAGFASPRDASIALTEPWPPFIEKDAQPLETDGSNAPASAAFHGVGPEYFVSLGISLRAGRAFTSADRPGSEPVALVSESLAQELWPDRTALGQRIRALVDAEQPSPLAEWRRVIGVVQDVRQTYADRDLADVYIPFLQAPARFAPLYVRSREGPNTWLPALREAARAVDPYIVVNEPVSLREEDRQRASTQFLTTLLGGFAAFAVFLAVLGIYGVTTYAAQQREREVAIRVAIGASRRAIINLVLRDGAAVVLAGIAAGLLGAGFVSRLLQHQLHGVAPLDPWTFLSASLLLLAAGIAAALQPAHRLAVRTPLRSLLDG